MLKIESSFDVGGVQVSVSTTADNIDAAGICLDEIKEVLRNLSGLAPAASAAQVSHALDTDATPQPSAGKNTRGVASEILSVTDATPGVATPAPPSAPTALAPLESPTPPAPAPSAPLQPSAPASMGSTVSAPAPLAPPTAQAPLPPVPAAPNVGAFNSVPVARDKVNTPEWANACMIAAQSKTPEEVHHAVMSLGATSIEAVANDDLPALHELLNT